MHLYPNLPALKNVLVKVKKPVRAIAQSNQPMIGFTIRHHFCLNTFNRNFGGAKSVKLTPSGSFLSESHENPYTF